jgi:hypothetical protein
MAKRSFMEPKEIKFEDMKNLNNGDQVMVSDPCFKSGVVYGLMSKVDGSFYFVAAYGSTLMVSEQETIDAFNVKLIDNTHSDWNEVLHIHTKTIANMLEQLDNNDNIHSIDTTLNIDSIIPGGK